MELLHPQWYSSTPRGSWCGSGAPRAHRGIVPAHGRGRGPSPGSGAPLEEAQLGLASSMCQLLARVDPGQREALLKPSSGRGSKGLVFYAPDAEGRMTAATDLVGARRAAAGGGG